MTFHVMNTGAVGGTDGPSVWTQLRASYGPTTFCSLGRGENKSLRVSRTSGDRPGRSAALRSEEMVIRMFSIHHYTVLIII